MKKILKNIFSKKLEKREKNALSIPMHTHYGEIKSHSSFKESFYHKNVIVYRCINLIARGLSSIPWRLYEEKNNGESHELFHHAYLDLLHCPSPKHAGTAFLEGLVTHLLLSGNAYIDLHFEESETVPSRLHVLRPDRINVICSLKTEHSFLPHFYEYINEGERVLYPVDPLTGQSKILHLKFFHPRNDYYGLSPLEAAKSAIDQHNTVSAHNLSILQNGGRPSGALMIKGALSQEQRETLRFDLKEAYEGCKNAGRLLILEGDMEWKDMGLSPKDLDFVAGKQMSAREIAQVFGVPPMLVGVPGDATFANYKEARYHLWEDTILPLLEYIIAEFNLWLTPFFDSLNQYAQLNKSKLRLAYDKDAIPAIAHRRDPIWQNVMQADFLTTNEKRAALGYGPLDGGDTLKKM